MEQFLAEIRFSSRIKTMTLTTQRMSKREMIGSVNSTFCEKVFEESYLQKRIGVSSQKLNDNCRRDKSLKNKSLGKRAKDKLEVK